MISLLKWKEPMKMTTCMLLLERWTVPPESCDRNSFNMASVVGLHLASTHFLTVFLVREAWFRSVPNRV